jgi:hypothetical protein
MNLYKFRAGETVDNSQIDFAQLLRESGVFVSTTGQCYCPFHKDKGTGHRSAKVYPGREAGEPDRLYCFGSCGKQYRATDFIQLVLGVPVIPSDKERVYEPKRIDLSFLDPFRDGSMTIEQFCASIHRFEPVYIQPEEGANDAGSPT